MMFGTMQSTGLYPPLYVTRPIIDRESVIVFLRNENRPTAWVQVSDYIDKHGSIRNAHVRTIMGTDNVLAVSKQIKKWEGMGLLVVVDPLVSKALRSYVKPGSGGIQMSLSMGKG